MTTLIRGTLVCGASLALLAVEAGPVTRLSAQEPDDEKTRHIVAEEFVAKRPVGTGGAGVKPRYKRAAGPKAAATSGAEARLGVTIWRLRRAQPDAEGARLLIQESTGEQSWTAERVDADAPLDVGDRVRLAFESAHAGYLYVIDREQYQDGTFSDPYLIFPTTRTRGGDNRVEAGRLIEVPGQSDRPNYFSVRRSRPEQVAEVLSIVVAPSPLGSLVPSNGPQVLPAADVLRWEKQWGGAVEQFVLEGGAARPWTSTEQRAGADISRLLTQDDPPPQTVFRVKAKAGTPVLVTLRLPYGAGPSRP
jgi:hypothetical protein